MCIGVSPPPLSCQAPALHLQTVQATFLGNFPLLDFCDPPLKFRFFSEPPKYPSLTRSYLLKVTKFFVKSAPPPPPPLLLKIWNLVGGSTTPAKRRGDAHYDFVKKLICLCHLKANILPLPHIMHKPFRDPPKPSVIT